MSNPEARGESRVDIPPPPPVGTLPDSAMYRGFGPLLSRLFRFLFRHIEPDLDTLPVVREAARNGTIVYAMQSRSLVDYLVFNTYLLNHGLPLATWTNGLDTTLWGPWRSALRRLRFQGLTKWAWKLEDERSTLRRRVRQGHCVFLFLRERRGARVLNRRDLLIELFQAEQTAERPVYLVPQSILWGRSTEYRGPRLAEFFYGERGEGSRLRKLFNFFLFRRNAAIRMAPPVDLRAFRRERADLDDTRLARSLGLHIRRDLVRERKLTRGPIEVPRRELLDAVMRRPQVQAALLQEVAESNDPARVERRARQLLDGIAARYVHEFVVLAKNILDVVTARVYAGVEFHTETRELIRRAAQHGTVVLVPCHRSHFDYLLVSWCMFHARLQPPHIAAGSNLSFFPLGPYLRRCGAFFIRRSIGGDELYRRLLAGYVAELCRREYTQEFFIEGGRSRSGKMLPARVGLLGMYVDTVLAEESRDVQLIPLAIQYERVAEEKEYLRELSGGEKQKEGIGSLARVTGVLKHRFGRVYLRASEPVSIKQWLADGGMAGGASYDESPEAERHSLLMELGTSITWEIDRCMPVTPSAVAAAALLSHDGRGLSISQFRRRGRYLLTQFAHQGAPLSDALQARGQDALDEALGKFRRQKLVEIVREGSGATDILVGIPEDQRQALDYYRNNVMGRLCGSSLIAAVLLPKTPPHDLPSLKASALRLARLMAREFPFDPRRPSDAWIQQALDELVELGCLEWEEETGSAALRVRNPQALAFHAAHIRPLLEAYGTTLKWLAVAGETVSQGDIRSALQPFARRLLLTGSLRHPESVSRVTLTNAFRHLRGLGVLEAAPTADDSHWRICEEERKDWYVWLAALQPAANEDLHP